MLSEGKTIITRQEYLKGNGQLWEGVAAIPVGKWYGRGMTD